MIAFTICSNNYLAKAKVVSDTFLQHHTGYSFFIFVVDKMNEALPVKELNITNIITIDKVVADIETLAVKYNIIELNTAVKPAVFSWLLEKNNSNIVIYLDPDLLVTGSFTEVEAALSDEGNNMVITPHFLSPIDDGKYPSEIDFHLYGIYNLGFIAIKNSDVGKQFLEWWHERLMKYCYIWPGKGMFTDQVWVNYAPVFFTGVCILRHAGYNVANWNLYERKLSLKDGNFFINKNIPLKFFHFSHYDFDEPYKISKMQTRHVIEDLPELKLLINKYQHKLIENKMDMFSKSTCYYQDLHIKHKAAIAAQQNTLSRRLKSNLKKYLKVLLD